VTSTWVLPRGNKSALCGLSESGYRDDPRLIEIASVPMPPGAVHALDSTAELLVYGHRGTVGAIRLHGETPAAEGVHLPGGHSIHAVALRDEVIYVGSSGSTEILGLIDLRGSRRWTSVEVPSRFRYRGKGVDGIALRGNRLVAVDDIVIPRYLFVYDISEPRAPRFVEACEFPWGLTGESVVSVASDGPWMAVLSHYANHGFAGSHIALVSLETLRWSASLVVERPSSLRHIGGHPRELSAVALSGTRLLLAAAADGIGSVDVGRWLGPEEAPRLEGPEARAAFTRIPLEEVRFQPLASGPACGVIAAGAQVAFAIVRSDPRQPHVLDTEIVQLP
jgi:hypothetical protein